MKKKTLPAHLMRYYGAIHRYRAKPRQTRFESPQTVPGDTKSNRGYPVWARLLGLVILVTSCVRIAFRTHAEYSGSTGALMLLSDGAMVILPILMILGLMPYGKDHKGHVIGQILVGLLIVVSLGLLIAAFMDTGETSRVQRIDYRWWVEIRPLQ